MQLVIDYLNDREFRPSGNVTLGETLTLKIINLPVDANTTAWSWEQRKDPGLYPINWDSGVLLQADSGTGSQGTVTFNPDWNAGQYETWFATVEVPLATSIDLVLGEWFSMSLVFSGQRCSATYMVNAVNEDGGGQSIIQNELPIITSEKKLINNKGTWNASTNTPDISASEPREGDYYTVSVAGSTSLGGRTDWVVGEAVYYDGENWKKANHITIGKNNKLVDVDVADYANDTIALETALRMLDRNGNYRSILDIVDSLTCPVDVDFEDYNNYRITSSTGAKIDLGRTVQWRIVRFNNLVIDHLWVDTDHIDRNDRAFWIGDGTNLVFDSNFTQNGAFGLFIAASDNVEVSDISVTNNRFEGQGRNDTIGGGQLGWLGKVKNVTILGNTINTRLLNVGEEFTGDPIAGIETVNGVVTAVNPVIAYVAAINLVGQENFIITNNNCKGGVYAGFEKSPHHHINISDNMVAPPDNQLFARVEVLVNSAAPEATAPSADIRIQNNSLDRTKVFLLGKIDGKLSYINISGNYIEGKGKYYQHSEATDPADPNYGLVSNEVVSQSGLTSYAGIRAIHCENMIIANNHVRDCRIGVLLNTTNNVISNSNIFHSCAKGIDYSQNNSVVLNGTNLYIDVDTDVTSSPINLRDIPNLLTHFDMSSSSYITQSGGRVTSISEASGGTLTANQNNAETRPTFVSNLFGSTGGVHFDGSDELIVSSPINLTGEFTTFFVVKTDVALQAGTERAYLANAGVFLEGYSDTNFTHRTLNTGSATGFAWPSGTNTTLVVVTRDAAGNVKAAVNSTVFTPLFSGSPQIGTRTAQIIGSRGGTDHWLGGIGEMIVYNRALTTQEISDIEGYLSSKFNINIS